MSKDNHNEQQFQEGIEGLKSYLKNVRSGETIDPTAYVNPFTKKPFEREKEALDYWIDLLDVMPPQTNLGPNPNSR